MKLSEIDIKKAFKEVLESASIGVDVYTDSPPTASLPVDYIELKQNGSVRSNSTRLGVASGVLMLIINVKLLSTGQRNSKRETIIASALDSIFENNKTVRNGIYHFSLDLNNLVYDGLSIAQNYSTKITNIKVSIY